MVDSYNGGGLTPEQVAELDNAAAEALDMKIKNCGDYIRKLKAEKASKDQITEEVNVLKLLKSKFKNKTGEEWKPANVPAEPKKEKKEPVKNEAPKTDGEKSDKQLKREAKKAEKQQKKAQHKAENQGDQSQQQAGEDDGVDVSEGKYGVAKMNQSRDKPDIRLIENFAILTEKLDNQMVGSGQDCIQAERKESNVFSC